jgi:hypothetical protein
LGDIELRAGPPGVGERRKEGLDSGAVDEKASCERSRRRGRPEVLSSARRLRNVSAVVRSMSPSRVTRSIPSKSGCSRIEKARPGWLAAAWRAWVP